MAYSKTNDVGNYAASTTANAYYTNARDLTAPASRAFVVTPSANELTRYAKKLHIFVPAATALATVAVVLLADADNAPVTLSFGPGSYVIDLFVRRVTAVTGSGVIVTAFGD